jgi:DNA-binding transcriptional ArsR family regulator
MGQYCELMDGLIESPYAISLVGFKPELVVKPMISQIRSIKTLVLFYTQHPRSTTAMNSISTTLNDIGIKVVRNQIKDVFNFFEIFMSAEYFCTKYGEPVWVNTTAGPGLGASALTMFASVHGVDLVSYDEGKDETRLVHLSELNDLLQCGTEFKRLLVVLKKQDNCSMEHICLKLGISKSTASRQIKILRGLNLINVSGSGRGRSPFIISLSAWGKQYCKLSNLDDIISS